LKLCSLGHISGPLRIAGHDIRSEEKYAGAGERTRQRRASRHSRIIQKAREERFCNITRPRGSEALLQDSGASTLSMAEKEEDQSKRARRSDDNIEHGSDPLVPEHLPPRYILPAFVKFRNHCLGYHLLPEIALPVVTAKGRVNSVLIRWNGRDLHKWRGLQRWLTPQTMRFSVETMHHGVGLPMLGALISCGLTGRLNPAVVRCTLRFGSFCSHVQPIRHAKTRLKKRGFQDLKLMMH
jgi:hypothetical protein